MLQFAQVDQRAGSSGFTCRKTTCLFVCSRDPRDAPGHTSPTGSAERSGQTITETQAALGLAVFQFRSIHKSSSWSLRHPTNCHYHLLILIGTISVQQIPHFPQLSITTKEERRKICISNYCLLLWQHHMDLVLAAVSGFRAFPRLLCKECVFKTHMPQSQRGHSFMWCKIPREAFWNMIPEKIISVAKQKPFSLLNFPVIFQTKPPEKSLWKVQQWCPLPPAGVWCMGLFSGWTNLIFCTWKSGNRHGKKIYIQLKPINCSTGMHTITALQF